MMRIIAIDNAIIPTKIPDEGTENRKQMFLENDNAMNMWMPVLEGFKDSAT